jgi:TatD DNase family protein
MIDTHCHLADEAFDADRDRVAARARDAGLSTCLCILAADDAAELSRAAAVTSAWPGVVFATGVHPHRSGVYADRLGQLPALVDGAVERTGASVIGEIGLDYHYDPAPRDVQRAVFQTQVTLALARNLPIVIHTRDAMPDTLAVLRESGPGLRAVLHCFTGSVDEAEAALALGAYISLSGIVTFPKAGSLRELAAVVPADRLFIETDAPYLAPVPHRGQRNEPAWVAATYEVVAAARDSTVSALAALVRDNFRRFLHAGKEPGAR